MRLDEMWMLIAAIVGATWFSSSFLGLGNTNSFIQEHQLIMAERNVGNVSLLMQCSALQAENPKLQEELKSTKAELAQSKEERSLMWSNLNTMGFYISGVIGAFVVVIFQLIDAQKKKADAEKEAAEKQIMKSIKGKALV